MLIGLEMQDKVEDDREKLVLWIWLKIIIQRIKKVHLNSVKFLEEISWILLMELLIEEELVLEIWYLILIIEHQEIEIQKIIQILTNLL